MNINKNSTLLTFASLLIFLVSCADIALIGLDNVIKTNIKEVEELTEKTMTQVTIKTSVGDIQLELNDEKAPITVENFKAIAQSGYYEGTIFHRVINGFMVQGGGLTADMNNKSSGTSPIQNEANNGLSNDSCLLYTSPSPRDRQKSRMPSSA